ncbi:conidial yellow pigment biosynthesis polyketide synthase [Penicillium canescens]|nr:conidial yellow pigment biosynthesis polyketide synthase [Penicillium canescens]
MMTREWKAPSPRSRCHCQAGRPSPYWIDLLIHISGFVMNGNGTLDHAGVYITDGWETLRLAGALDSNQSYQSPEVQQFPESSGSEVSSPVWRLPQSETGMYDRKQERKLIQLSSTYSPLNSASTHRKSHLVTILHTWVSIH